MPDKLGMNRKKNHKVNRWVTARKATQGIALVVFLFSVVFSKNFGIPATFSKNLIQISPLAMFAELLSSKTFLAGSTISLIILLSSFIVGRAWCGWLCPFGTLLDIFHINKNEHPRKLSEKFRRIKYGLLIIILLSAIFGNLTLLILDPLTIFIRSATLTILPIIDKTLFFLEKNLVKVSWLQEPIYKFDAWLRPAVLPTDSQPIPNGILFAFFFVSIFLLNAFAERFWCRYLCPLGALLGLPSRIALVQRKNSAICSNCGLCNNNCPTGTINPEKGYQSDPSECILCMNCLDDCARKSTSFPMKWQPAVSQTYDPNRRTFLHSIGISIFTLALFQTNKQRKTKESFLLRPPGVSDPSEFLSKCVRCGLCIQVCPTQALQADLGISGFEGINTPVMMPRIGACLFSCASCGQICPVNAIPLLTLDEKRITKIGNAYIDKNRCIAWADHDTCLVCEEMCPLPEKAITLERATFNRLDGTSIEVSLPEVDRDKCIGCGICENKCPVSGEAAIRVFTF